MRSDGSAPIAIPAQAQMMPTVFVICSNTVLTCRQARLRSLCQAHQTFVFLLLRSQKIPPQIPRQRAACWLKTSCPGPTRGRIVGSMLVLSAQPVLRWTAAALLTPTETLCPTSGRKTEPHLPPEFDP